MYVWLGKFFIRMQSLYVMSKLAAAEPQIATSRCLMVLVLLRTANDEVPITIGPGVSVETRLEVHDA